MRAFRRWFVMLTALPAVAAVACSSGDDEGTTGPGGGNTGTTVTLSAAEKSTVAASLNALATRVGAADVNVRQFINALAFGVQQASTATDVDVATNLDVLGDDAGVATRGVSFSSAMATRRVLGYSVTISTSQPGQRTYRGGIVWDAGGSKVIVTLFGNPNILSVTYPSAGNTAYLASSATQVWTASAGSAQWTLINGNSEQCPRPLPNVLATCGYEDGTVPFTISSSAPAVFSGNTASGSRTASLGGVRVRVLFFSIVCGSGGVC